MAKRSAIALCEIGHPRELPMLKDAVWKAQPAHVGILRRRDIKQAVIAPAKIIRRRRRCVIERLLLQPRISIERMLFAFEFFLVGELFARRENLVLRLEMGSV